MGPLESVLVGLSVHLGSKIINRLWDAAKGGRRSIVSQTGSIALVEQHHGQLDIQRRFSAPSAPESAAINGRLFLPTSVGDTLMGDEIPLVLIVEETGQQTFLFEVELEAEFSIYLPPGIYSFYVFLMDSTSHDFYSAEIFAIGFPAKGGFSAVSDFELDDHDDIWNFIEDSPFDVTDPGMFNMDFILLDTAMVPEFPNYFSDMLGDPQDIHYRDIPFQLTGTWRIEEEYEHGTTIAQANLVQVGNQVQGFILILDIMDDGSELILQESVYGEIEGIQVFLEATGIRILSGHLDDYFLDRWEGVMESEDLITGYSEDEAGTRGRFLMTREY